MLQHNKFTVCSTYLSITAKINNPRPQPDSPTKNLPINLFDAYITVIIINYLCWFQAAPVLESEPIQQVPQMQITVNNLQASAEQIRADAEQV